MFINDCYNREIGYVTASNNIVIEESKIVKINNVCYLYVYGHTNIGIGTGYFAVAIIPPNFLPNIPIVPSYAYINSDPNGGWGLCTATISRGIIALSVNGHDDQIYFQIATTYLMTY